MFALGPDHTPAPLCVVYDYVRQTGRYNMAVGEEGRVWAAILAVAASLRQPLPWDELDAASPYHMLGCIHYAYRTFPGFSERAKSMARALPGGEDYAETAGRWQSAHASITMDSVLDEALRESERWAHWARTIEHKEDALGVAYGARRLAREGRFAPVMSKKQQASLGEFMLQDIMTHPW
jgi:hypothetical protein